MLDRNTPSWGQLDAIARLLEEMAEPFIDSWNGGEYRMKPGDCQRLAAYLGRIKVSTSQMRDTLKLYENLAARPDAQILISKAIHHEGNLQKKAAQLSPVGTD